TTTSTPTTPTTQAPTTPTTPNPDATDPTAVITSVPSINVVGQAIHVQALNSTLGGGTALTAKFEWDFGDDGSKYNNLVGFNAAHIYDKAGTYTITLTVTNEGGKSDSVTRTVSIAADNRKTIYVDANGSDSNS